MICLGCICAINGKPFNYYWCSRVCWEQACRETPWRIHHEILASTGHTAYFGQRDGPRAYFPRPREGPRCATHRRPAERLDIRVGMLPLA